MRAGWARGSRSATPEARRTSSRCTARALAPVSAAGRPGTVFLPAGRSRRSVQSEDKRSAPCGSSTWKCSSPWRSPRRSSGSPGRGRNESVQDARNGKRELRDRRLEARAILGHHLVGTAHRADGRRDGGAARVLVALARLQQRLRADDAEAAYFLHEALRVGDDPMAADELRGDVALVTDGDGVGEDVTTVRLIGLVGEVLRLRADGDVVLFLSGHGPIVNSAARVVSH